MVGSRNSQQPVECDLYLPGHRTHWIQLRRASAQRHRWGRLVAVDDDVISVAYLDDVARYRNHQAGNLLDVAAPGTKVAVSERYRMLRVDVAQRTSKCFCIAVGDDSWTPCSYEALISVTPQSQSERLSTHGGFTVVGAEVLKGLEVTDG